MAIHSADRGIRLLDLLPGTREDEIRCKIRVVSLNQHPDYEALSYVWGGRTEEKGIEVSGQRVFVTRNLYDGLQRLRYPETKRTFWIDQICINQWDMKEKAHQVALMRDIYKQCSKCVTWMGEFEQEVHGCTNSDAQAVFDFLRQVAAAKTTPMKDLPILFQSSAEGHAARKAFQQFSMYGNPWWSRIWTVQEAIIPTSGELMWGPRSIPQQDVIYAARNLRDLHEVKNLPVGFAACRYKYAELLRRLLYPVHGFSHSKTDGSLNLLMRWRHREATDPRDKVYALLGLIPLGVIPSAQSCDYTISVSELFEKVTLDLIKYEGNLRPLLAACEMPQKTPGISTWSIDFASCNYLGHRQMRWWGHSHRYYEFSASKGSRMEMATCSNNESLLLSGVYVDEILESCKLLCVEAYEHVGLFQCRKPISDCLLLMQKFWLSRPDIKVYHDGFTWESALCRTLVGDLIMDEYPVDRLSSYGRASLLYDFNKLFAELGVLERLLNGLGLEIDANLNMDFADDISSAEDLERGRRRNQVKKTRLANDAIAADISDVGKEGRFQSQLASELLALGELFESLVGMIENQAFFITKSGYIGIGPLRTQPGDQVWVFQGGNVPFVMRNIEEDKRDCPQLTLVGDAYVQSIMDGEIMEDEPLVQTVHVH